MALTSSSRVTVVALELVGHPAAVEQVEPVADHVRVVRVVGDEHDRDHRAHAPGGCTSGRRPDCLTPSALVGSSRMSTLAPK
jgi:hypothetical protein